MWLEDNYELREGMVLDPVIWRGAVKLGVLPPRPPDEVLQSVFPPGKKVWPFQGWAHDKQGVHYIGTQDGLRLHLDLASPRYSHQVVLRNDGWNIQGRDPIPCEPFTVGSYYCLDTHSPHRVIPDSRLGNGGRYFVAIVFDRPAPMAAARAWEILRVRIRDLVPKARDDQTKGSPS